MVSTTVEHLSADEYSKALAQGRKGITQSVIAVIVSVLMVGMGIVFVAGLPRNEDPNLIEMAKEGINTLRHIFPTGRTTAVVGVLATVFIAHTVSTRSLYKELNDLPDPADLEKTKLVEAVKQASQLQGLAISALVFSVLGGGLSVVITVVVGLNGDAAAAIVAGLLSLFLFFELMRLYQGNSAIELFKGKVSDKQRAAYQYAFRTRRGQRAWRVVWYVFFALAIIFPAASSAVHGHLVLAYRSTIVGVVIWSLGLSLSIAYVRETVGVARSSRVIARGLGAAIFFVVWCVADLITLAFMAEAEVSDWSEVWPYIIASLLLLVGAFLRIWGESGWLVFSGFGERFSSTLRTAMATSLAETSWSNRPKGTVWWAAGTLATMFSLVGVLVGLNFKPQQVWTSVIIVMLALFISGVARWSVMIERIAYYALALALLTAMASKVIRDGSEAGNLTNLFTVVTTLILLAVLSALTWDRQKRFRLARPLLSIFDMFAIDTGRKMLEELGETSDLQNDECTEESEPAVATATRLLAKR